MFPLNYLADLIQNARDHKKKPPLTTRKTSNRLTLEVERLERRELLATGIVPAPTFTGPTSPLTNTTPTFSWTRIDGATQYDLWVDNVTTGQAQLIRKQSLAFNAFTPTTPLPAASYQAWVRATTRAGTSPWSATYSFTIAPPAVPTLTSPVGSIANLTPTFSWSASTGASRYDLWVSNLSTGQTQFIRQQNLTTTSFTPANPLPQGSYQTWVRAFNNAVDPSSWSAGVSFTINTAPTMTSPTGSTPNTTPAFTWTTSPGATRYDLWVNNLTTGQNQIVRQQNLTTTFFTAATPLPVGSYIAWVAAFKGTTSLGWSAGLNFTILAPAAPTLTGPAATTTDTTPTFTWTASPGASQYDVWAQNQTTGQSQVVRQTVSGTSYTPSSPIPRGQYTVWVRAANNAGAFGAWSAGYNFLLDTTAPAIPTITGPTSPSASLSPVIMWSASAGTARYDLWVDNQTTGKTQLIRQQTLTTNSYTPATALTPGSYAAWVEAFDNTNQTRGWSPTFHFTVTQPTAPTPIVVKAGPSLNGNEGAAIQFNGSASGGSGTLSYVWSFGDGATATTLTASHAYLRDGNYTATLTVSDTRGSMASSTTTVTIHDVAPNVNSGGPYGGTPGTAIQFTGIASVPDPTDTLTYLWNFGDGSTSSEQSPTHAYASAKTYNVSLTVTDSEGLSTTSRTTVVVNPNMPIVTLSPSTGGVEGSSISFSGTASGGVGTLTYSWSFGDGGTASGTLTPSHTYVSDGTYTAKLTVTDSLGDTASATTPVTVANVAPTVSIGGPYNGSAGTAISFNPTASVPDPTDTLSYSWSFGDGFTSTQRSPTHTYAAPAFYTVSLTVTDSEGLSTSASTTVVVVAAALAVSAGPNESGNEGTSISFSGTASGGVGALIYSWAFGDGGTATGTLTPSHTYVTDGSYTATLTVTDSHGSSGSATTTVTVNNVAPTVSSGGPYSGTPGNAVSFQGTASVPDPTDTLSYLWDFGDGATSNQQSPTHSYAGAGTYNVSLTVTDSEEASTTAKTTAVISAVALIVNAGPAKSGNEGAAIQFSGSASGGTGALTYSWKFGDGGTAAGSLTPTHTYTTDGTYTATLTVTDAASHSSSATTTVTVNDVAPTVNAGGPYSGAVGATISFTGTASVPDPTDTFSYSWKFGDGATSTKQSPTHSYASAGTYSVTLTVTDSEGLSATANTSVAISSSAPSFLNNANPPPLPAPAGAVVNVSTVSALQSAVANLQSGQTIVIAPGTYNLTAGLYIGHTGQVTNVAIRGATNNPGDVVLLGQGMDNANGIGMGISVWNAQNVTIADLSIGNVYYDDIELKGDQGADRITIYNCHLFDSGEQIIKSDPNPLGGGVTNSSVMYCTIGYTTAPSTVDHGGGTGYTNGVDVHGGSNWVVSDNLFQNFHTPDNSANLWNPTVLFWNHSANNTVTANTFTNCDRAIAFGLNELASGFDNQGGLIANNFVYMALGEYSASRQAGADAPIIAWDSPGTTIAFNTILTNGNTPNSVQARFVETTGVSINDNLADAPLRSRDGAVYITGENYLSATPSMFVNAAIGDLHLVSNSSTQANVIGKAVSPTTITTDYDGQARNSPSDIGADQYASSFSPLQVTAGPSQVGNEGSAIQFSGTASGGTGTLTYSWNFGDGGTATGTLAPTHTYVTDGSYQATLTVTDVAGHTSSNSTSVTVNNVAPTVNIGGPYNGAAGSAIQFSGAAVTPDPTDTFTFAWNFGDGATSNQQNPSHVYTGAGSFNVSLTVTDSDGLSSSALTTVTISSGPAIGTLAATPNAAPAGTQVTLTAGNVTDNSGIVTQVAFYTSQVGGSNTHSPTDTLLGNGVKSGLTNTWTLTTSTTGLASGTYTIFAQATDSNGMFSVVSAVNLTVQ
jgi:PKD repeat protein